MDINDLFVEIEKNLSNSPLINGNFTLNENDSSIIWEYSGDDDIIDNSSLDFDEDNDYGFDSLSDEEKLMEMYENELTFIEGLFEQLDVLNDLCLDEPSISENTISFSISF